MEGGEERKVVCIGVRTWGWGVSWMGVCGLEVGLRGKVGDLLGYGLKI